MSKKKTPQQHAAELRRAGLSIRDIAAQVGRSKSTVQRWSKSGDSVTIGGTTVTPKTPEVKAINSVLRSLPPAGGSWTLPSVQQFVGIVQSISRFYRNPDQAIQASPQNARTMFNNLTIREPLQARMLATAELPWEVEPEDKKDRGQQKVAQAIRRTIEEIPDFLKFRQCLLYAIWFGKFAVQNRYEWSYRSGRKRLKVRDWSPVHGDTLVPKWDANTWGIYTGLYTGYDGTKEVTTEAGFLSRAHVLSDSREQRDLSVSERQAFCIHTHDYFPGDFLDPQSAGGVKGLGIRSVVYWTWYVMNEVCGWLVEFLERTGLGVTIWRYARGNAESEAAVRTVAESQSNQAAILFPVDPSLGHNVEDVQRIEPSPVGIENMMRVLDEYWGAQIRRYIIGQDATSRPVPSGMNSGVAAAHETTFNRLVRYDAQNLSDTLTRDLVAVIQEWDFPDADFPCKFVINVDRPGKETLEGVRLAYEMGVSFDEDEVRGITGMSKPDLDAFILRKEKPEKPQEAKSEKGQEEPQEGPKKPEAQAGGEAQGGQPGTSDLRQTVGGLTAISALQQAFYAGQLPKEAAVNNVILLFGFTPQEADSLFPEKRPVDLTEGDEPAKVGKARHSKSLDVPDVRQRHGYDCGPAAVASVLEYFGEEADIGGIADPDRGTPPDAMIRSLRAQGLRAEGRAGMSVADLVRLTGEGTPVICCLQYEEDDADEVRREASGHYVVVTGAGPDSVTFQNPSRGQETIAADEFLSRWHDNDGERRYVRYGIAVTPAGS